MLFNIEEKKIKNTALCVNCKCFDKKTKTCNGIGKVCFEYDEKIQTLIDPITKMPLKIERGN